MKSIQLNTAVVDNAGRRIEAGTRIAVGPKANQIAADRAKELVARASATTIREDKTPSGAGAKAKVAQAKVSKPKSDASPLPPAPSPAAAQP